MNTWTDPLTLPLTGLAAAAVVVRRYDPGLFLLVASIQSVLQILVPNLQKTSFHLRINHSFHQLMRRKALWFA